MTTRRLSALVVGLFLALAVAASAQSNEEKYQAKLNSDFLKKADWITDYDKAREAAAETGKPIFAYFTRSYSP